MLLFLAFPIHHYRINIRWMPSAYFGYGMIQIANYAQTECQFRYCGTAIPFLTVRSTAR